MKADSLDEVGGSGSWRVAVATDKITRVKVFSATRAKDRERLGEVVTAWIADNSDVRVLQAIVNLSSDSEFHCLSIVLLCGPA